MMEDRRWAQGLGEDAETVDTAAALQLDQAHWDAIVATLGPAICRSSRSGRGCGVGRSAAGAGGCMGLGYPAAARCRPT